MSNVDVSTVDPDHASDVGEPTTVLIAVDAAATSVRLVRTAHRLFGEGARYFVMNVGRDPNTDMNWAYASPIVGAAVWYPATWTDEAVTAAVSEGIEHAEHRASEVASQVTEIEATPLGVVGDPAEAIIKAAHDHGAEVVVVGAHDRGWFSRLLERSVEREVLRVADFAVLVVR